MTQKEIVLRALQQAGTRGVHTNELRQLYIANPSQRILELEAEGHLIRHTRERLHGRALGARYALISEPSRRPVREQPAGDGQAVSLFGEDVGRPGPGSAIYGDEAA